MSVAPWVGRQVYYPVVYDGKLWITGGYGCPRGACGEVWSSPEGRTWTKTSDATWRPRYGQLTLVFNDKIWVIGGVDNWTQGTTVVHMNDVITSADGAQWTTVTNAAPWSPRYTQQGAVFKNEMWLISGAGTSYYRDVWRSSDGISWTNATSSPPWNAKSAAALVVFKNELWLMGGHEQVAGKTSDVWHSGDGVNWTLATANAPWGGRAGFSAIVMGNEIWIAGGQNSLVRPEPVTENLLNDIWHSPDGANWTKFDVASPWSVRQAFGLVLFNAQLWLIGGDGGRPGTDYRNDVWAFTPTYSGG